MTLPNFVIAGALKSGSTSLYKYLREHPQVYMSKIKETRFFNFDPDDPDHALKDYNYFPVRTLDAYQEQFDGLKGELAIGEATPSYLESPLAPLKMKEIIPDVRLLFSLRQPVDRLYSLYLMSVIGQKENRSVYEVCLPGGEAAMFFRYSPHFKRWLDYFDRSQMKIFLLEDLKSSPEVVLQDIFSFLEIDETFMPNLSKRHNVGGVPKNAFTAEFERRMRQLTNHRITQRVKPYLPGFVRSMEKKVRSTTLRKPDPLPKDLEQELQAFYRDDVLELQDLLEMDLSVWGL